MTVAQPPVSVQAQLDQGILTLTLNRPQVLNAIDLELAESLAQQIIAAAQNPAVRVIVLTGAGLAFCAGSDLKFAYQANPEAPGRSFLLLTSMLHRCIEDIHTMAKPVIAAINGPAAGAGLFLALACDLRIMAHSAYLKHSNTSYGLSIPAGGTFTLPRLVGLGRALEIAMLDEPISALEAHELGLVNSLVPASDLPTATQQLASRLAQRPVAALGQVKRLMNESFYGSLSEQLAAERQEIAIAANSLEGRESITAFSHKRQPQYMALDAAWSDRHAN
ncbi:MAG: enoyl-CoA hydratase-related protein [Nodosilinea sp.]